MFIHVLVCFALFVFVGCMLVAFPGTVHPVNFFSLNKSVQFSSVQFIGKRVDFLLALIELFSLGVTAEALRAIIGSKSAILLQRGPVDPKFQVEGVAPSTILLLSN